MGRKGEGKGRRGRNAFDDEADNGFARYEKKSKRKTDAPAFKDNGKKDDWKQFFNHNNAQLKGEEPDFSEEGWARRRPKKK